MLTLPEELFKEGGKGTESPESLKRWVNPPVGGSYGLQKVPTPCTGREVCGYGTTFYVHVQILTSSSVLQLRRLLFISISHDDSCWIWAVGDCKASLSCFPPPLPSLEDSSGFKGPNLGTAQDVMVSRV
jgi:hypothetical protein